MQRPQSSLRIGFVGIFPFRCQPKIGVVFTPQIIHLFIGFGTIIFTIHFLGVKSPLFLGETPICQYRLYSMPFFHVKIYHRIPSIRKKIACSLCKARWRANRRWCALVIRCHMTHMTIIWGPSRQYTKKGALAPRNIQKCRHICFSDFCTCLSTSKYTSIQAVWGSCGVIKALLNITCVLFLSRCLSEKTPKNVGVPIRWHHKLLIFCQSPHFFSGWVLSVPVGSFALPPLKKHNLNKKKHELPSLKLKVRTWNILKHCLGFGWFLQGLCLLVSGRVKS